MVAQPHPAFTWPEEDVPIWRYTDFAKFVAMLEHSGLFFVRADSLGDPFEGSIPRANLPLRHKQIEQVVEEGQFGDEVAERVRQSKSTLSGLYRTLRSMIGVTCWHMNKSESAAMWKLYGEMGSSIAIRSTFERLKVAVPDNIYVGVVNYIDFDRDPISETNFFLPYTHKRKSYAHEREIRGVFSDFTELESGSPTDYAGGWVDVDLDQLVEGVYLAPQSEGWVEELVMGVLKRYGRSWPVVRSRLEEDPFY